MLLNSRSELLVCMIREGILQVIGDIIVSETDALVLVCIFFIYVFFLFHSFSFFVLFLLFPTIFNTKQPFFVVRYIFYMVYTESCSSIIVNDCCRMGFRYERSRRGDSRYNWKYPQDDHGLNS